MYFCSEEHDEICYEGLACPACDVILEKEQEIEGLREKLGELENA